jgi:hypothetical protein
MQQLNSSYCGSDRLAALVAPLLKPLQETREHVYPERFATRPPLSALFEGCGRRCDVEEAAHIAFVDHAYTLEEIGRMVARDPSVVCRWVQCVRRRRRGAPSSSENILARNKI